MTDASLILYVDSRFLSPYAMSAYVALWEKSLDFETRTVALADGGASAPDYAALSLTRRVPTLVHGTFALSESSAIAEYLDEVFAGRALYPRAPQQRARARQIQAWLRSDLLPIREARSTEVVFLRPDPTPLTEAAQAASGKLFAAVEQWLPEGQDNLFGDWCIADSDLALMLNRLVRNGDPVPSRLAAYAERQWQRASIQDWLRRVQA